MRILPALNYLTIVVDEKQRPRTEAVAKFSQPYNGCFCTRQVGEGRFARQINLRLIRIGAT
jgi:hypothetical protein